jgi:hypothetical protein
MVTQGVSRKGLPCSREGRVTSESTEWVTIVTAVRVTHVGTGWVKSCDYTAGYSYKYIHGRLLV